MPGWKELGSRPRNVIESARDDGSLGPGSVRDQQLTRLEPVHNKALGIAIGEFCVCRTENILCESVFESLAERRRRKTINMAIHVVENKL
jgi:hypothetical protein